MMRRLLRAAAVALVACRGTPPPPAAGQQDDIARLVDSLRPAVEQAAGLKFKGPTRSALKTRDEVRQYLLDKLKEEFPPSRQAGIKAVYTLLGLLPDTLNLEALLLDLYSEQVAGFYDPAQSTLFGVEGADPSQLRLVLAHELVHALQHQYLPLDSIMHLKGDNDHQTAIQAVLEGQATIASIRVLLPGTDALRDPAFWQTFREQIRAQQSGMQVFARSPLILREGLIFPYVSGAEFMRWWDSARAGTPLPTLATMPASTEQILHPDRYARGDRPVELRFAGDTAGVLYEDTLGELEVQMLATVLRGGGEVVTSAPIGWGGDRFRVLRSPGGPALVWYSVWDDEASALRFLGTAGIRLREQQRAGYRTLADRADRGGRSEIRVVIAPTGWTGWNRVPVLR